MNNTSPKFERNRFMQQASVAACTILLTSTLIAQDDTDQLNTVLDIDSLYTPLESKPIHGDTAVKLLNELETKHYSSVDINDNFSSIVFDNYIDALDGSKLYFLKEDINALSAYRYTLDNSLEDGSVEPGFEIYNVYYRRILERMIYAIDRVENHVSEMDFTTDETIEIDREDAPYAALPAELDELWRLRIKNSVLSLRLTGDEEEEIIDKSVSYTHLRAHET